MKSMILTILLTTVLLLTGCTRAEPLDPARIAPTPGTNTPQQETDLLRSTPTPDLLTQAEALDIALAHAGITAEEAAYLYSEFDIDDGVPLYEVSFHVGSVEYEYEIHADTGRILSFDKDR